MKAFPRTPGVQYNACGVLYKLTRDETICPKVVRSGGVLAILTAMRNNPDKSQVQEMACAAIAGLCKTDAALICRQGGIADIVAAMKTHLQVALVQEAACGAIWKLAINSKDEGRERIRRDGAIAAVEASMATHRTNDLIHTYGNDALIALAVREV